MASQIELVAGVDRPLPNVVSLFGTQHLEDELEKEKLAASEVFYDPAQPRGADGKWAGGAAGKLPIANGSYRTFDDYGSARAYHREQHLRQAGVWTEDESTAVRGYSQYGYRVNEPLRRGELPNTTAMIDSLDSALAKSTIAEPLTVFRSGFRESDRSGDGLIIQRGYTSSSLTKADAGDFGDGIPVRIDLPAGARAVFPAKNSENEVILPRNSKFKKIEAGHYELVAGVDRPLPPEQFMAVGQPRDSHGRWTKGGLDVHWSTPDDLHLSRLQSFLDETFPHQFSPDEVAVIRHYSGVGAAPVNAELRSGRSSEGGDELAQIIDRSEMTQEALLFRGIGLTRELPLNVGDEWTERGFTSTSAVDYVGAGYAGGGGTLMELRVPSGTKAISVEKALGQIGSEHEVVLQRGTKFKVVERTTREIDGLSKPINVAVIEVTQDA